jgi:hypothetical protein
MGGATMATIVDITLKQFGKTVAASPSAELQVDQSLVADGVVWVGGVNPLNLLQQVVDVAGTAAGRPYNATFTIAGISGSNSRVRLQPT